MIVRFLPTQEWSSGGRGNRGRIWRWTIGGECRNLRRRWCHANCLSPPPPRLCRCRLAVAAFRRPNSPFVRRNYSSIIARLRSISDNWRSYTGGVHAAKGCFSAKNPNLSPIICRAGTGIARSGTKICRGRTGSCNHRTGIGLRITMICRPIICQK